MAERITPVRASKSRTCWSWLMLFALVVSQALVLIASGSDNHSPGSTPTPTPVPFPPACSGQSLVAIDPAHDVGYVAIYQLDTSGTHNWRSSISPSAPPIRYSRSSRLSAPFNRSLKFTIRWDHRSSPRRVTEGTRSASTRSIRRLSQSLARSLRPASLTVARAAASSRISLTIVQSSQVPAIWDFSTHRRVRRPGTLRRSWIWRIWKSPSIR
jgi:hypothetical protein